MKKILKAYRNLLSILYKQSPVMVMMVFIFSVIGGLISPITIYINQQVFNNAIAVANQQMDFIDYVPTLVVFAILMIIPHILSMYIFGYSHNRTMLILRTNYRESLIEKLSRIKYEHFESADSREIIDKAFSRAEIAAAHFFPSYVWQNVSAIFATLGTFYIVFNVKWWMLLTIFIPAIIETYLESKRNFNIYKEMDSYYKQEIKYMTIAGFFKGRDYLKENTLNDSYDYLIDEYSYRLNKRNKDYEKYFFKALKWKLLNGNITKIAQVGNALLLLYFYISGQISIGTLIAVTIAVFGSIFGNFENCTKILRWGGYHLINYEYYYKYFDLSEEKTGDNKLPKTFDIEFRDVWFRYPGTEIDILKGVSFYIPMGQRISIVGENGEGKTTLIKLLLGLFTPDKGDILIGGESLFDFSVKARAKMFGIVFQDFMRYSISLKENVGIGDLESIDNNEKMQEVYRKGKIDEFLDTMPERENTILGRDFSGSVDLSGGQWQRIAISRAFMGDKPIILLDEPTSQLDPIAESNLYKEFINMVYGKTAVLITHRLASTMITDKIFVMHEGKITESGTHNELMELNGIYCNMFTEQKNWYEEEVEANE